MAKYHRFTSYFKHTDSRVYSTHNTCEPELRHNKRVREDGKGKRAARRRPFPPFPLLNTYLQVNALSLPYLSWWPLMYL
jgi:hypothetical protein